MDIRNPELRKEDIKTFRERTAAFYSGEIDKLEYKSISGYYGSYAQRGGAKNMLRLRMPAGQVTKETLLFLAGIIEKYRIERLHFTTCQTLQFHDLDGQTAADIMEEALEHGIVTMGGGGDYPRNVMCSPLSGVEPGEYFDVQPWAKAAGEYMMQFLKAEKLPRKLKIGFSNSPENLTHATYRDLGFAARPDGTFDVYSAGGLGGMPKFGIRTAEGVKPEHVLYYVRAMWELFHAYGNYENRAKARTRFLPEALGGPDAYRKAFEAELSKVFSWGGELAVSLVPSVIAKAGAGDPPPGPRILPQKQAGLYTAVWHPIGGMPDREIFCRLCRAVQDMEAVEMRLSPDQTAYLINLTGAEAETVLSITTDSAESIFEMSVSCIGGSTCQTGPRDSQALLLSCVKAVREAGLSYDALPKIHISGCPSSCGTHQTGVMGFRGAGKLADGKPQPAFALYLGGNECQGFETMGKEIGTILQSEIPAFLVELGKMAEESGLGFDAWRKENPGAIEALAEKNI